MIKFERKNTIFYMSHFFSYYYKTANFFMNPLLYLYQSAMTVSGTRWHFLSSNVFLINFVLCGHNIAGINGSKNFFLLNRWWSLLISGVVYKSAVDNYWSAMSSTNQRCSLLIRGVIYQSAGVNY